MAALLDRRRAAGKVRRCHGDLHLRNICLFEGKPTLFDAIEFSDAIAVIDVLYDLAFLLMDLMHRGMARLANLVFNRYLDRSGEDMAALAAMPLFLSLRSAIRAHVLVTAAASAAGRAGGGAVTSARTYLGLARALLRRQKPRLVAVGGMSGTGKSTSAQALAADFLPAPGARVLRSDVLRKLLQGVPPETPLPQAAYRPAVTRQVYGRIYADAAAALAAGYSVIADAAFLAAKERAAVAASASAAAASFTGLWLEASPSVLAARLDARIGDASDADRAVMEQQRRLDPGAVLWPRIAASADADAVLAAARAPISPRKAEWPGLRLAGLRQAILHVLRLPSVVVAAPFVLAAVHRNPVHRMMRHFVRRGRLRLHGRAGARTHRRRAACCCAAAIVGAASRAAQAAAIIID